MKTQEYYQLIDDNALQGFSNERRRFRENQVAATVALIGDVMSGRIPSYYMQEAIQPMTPAMVRALMTNYPGLIRVSESMTTSDFPLLIGDAMDRMVLAGFREAPSPWRRFMRVTNTLRDFRSVERLKFDGLEGQWDVVPEGTEFEYGALSELNYTYAPRKYAKGAKISFEALVNDDLGVFETIPERLGRGGARTIAKFATSLYVDANGPHASLYTVGNGNIVTGNPALSITALQTAMTQLAGLVDSDGEPIVIESMILVVPPALEITAMNIVNATAVELTVAGGISGQTLLTNNWFGSRFSVVVDPYIPIVASVADGNTSWYLFANPGVGRPALEMGFVRGFQEPQLYQKVANTARVGGGIDQMAGEWRTMAQEYKGVVAFGGTRLDPATTVASEGDGS